MKHRFFVLSLFSTILLSSCGMNESAVETLVAEKVSTAVLQTIESMPTQTPLPTSTPLPTATPTSTETPVPTATATDTPVDTPISQPEETQVVLCDNAGFVSDVTIPDGTQLAPGQAFTKIWRIRNIGTCTWNAEYAVVFTVGDSMDGVSPQLFPDQIIVEPSETIDIAIDMIAPSEIGTYTGYWQLRNADKDVFEVAFYVQIEVTAGVSTVTGTPTESSATLTPTVTDTDIPTETPTP